MIAGLDRYFQIARCFRDEDLRADRRPEFTQVDIEMSFADEKQVMDMAEGLMIRRSQGSARRDIPAPFPRMTWDEAMSRYGVDKPDTRFGLELQDVTSIVSNSGFKLFASAKLVKAMRVPGGENLTRKEIDELTEFRRSTARRGSRGSRSAKTNGSRPSPSSCPMRNAPASPKPSAFPWATSCSSRRASPAW